MYVPMPKLSNKMNAVCTATASKFLKNIEFVMNFFEKNYDWFFKGRQHELLKEKNTHLPSHCRASESSGRAERCCFILPWQPGAVYV
jgi:hypothetical protein